jgi:hypothetical protein
VGKNNRKQGYMKYKETPLIPHELNEKYRIDCLIMIAFMIIVGCIGIF